MPDLEVRIVKLDPIRVATVRAVSGTPEHDAWEKMRAWAEPRGFLGDVAEHPVFGFNNPSPSPDQKEYGYEFWIRVGSDVKPEGDIEMKDFPGGLYAVTTCKQLSAVGETWMNLLRWVQSPECRYRWRKTHELEKQHDPLGPEENMVLDLYLPIEPGEESPTSGGC